MTGRHIGNDGEVRLDDIPQPRYFTPLARSNLDDKCVRMVRSCEDCLWDTDQVVHVGGGRVHGPSGSQDRGQHLLGRCLAVRPRHPNYRPHHLATPGGRQRAECDERIIDLEELEALYRASAPAYDGRRRSCGACRIEKVMAVKPIACERNEQRSEGQHSRVGADIGKGRGASHPRVQGC